ncbi:MAG: HAD-IIB family hydrolase [Candidatus Saccharibacteria bacterium]|nr:HAD-IIB family hydrolase [Candidatus Saccharibacteria bacterium]
MINGLNSKKVIAFDLDDTLAVAKSQIPEEISELLVRLLDKFDVCIISGGKFDQFKVQVLDRLDATPYELTHLHLMPTSGTKYFIFDEESNGWDLQYDNSLTDDQKKRAIYALEEGAKKLGLWEEKPFGEIIEDRESQVTYSALGQKAPADLKYKWDPDGSKKQKLRDYVAPILSDMGARTGGTTSVDVTVAGVDKAYGMKKLTEQMQIDKNDILFIGDKLQPGGNDYAVKAMGIDTIEVKNWQDTVDLIERILGEAN